MDVYSIDELHGQKDGRHEMPPSRDPQDSHQPAARQKQIDNTRAPKFSQWPETLGIVAPSIPNWTR
jgi:hypothetical protein